jgi:hypothetical protein
MAKTGWLICVEDPAWESAPARGPESRFQLGRWTNPMVKDRISVLLPTPRASDRRAFVQALADAYNKENQHWTVQVKEAGDYLVLVPKSAKDAGGVSRPASSPLDLKVDVPRASRMPEGHISAILQSVEAQTGFLILADVGGNVGPIRPFGLAFGSGDPGDLKPFEWGASGVSARQALLSVLEASWTTFTWSLRCSSGVHPHRGGCGLWVRSVKLEVKDRNGNLVERSLSRDRRSLYPPPPAPPDL